MVNQTRANMSKMFCQIINLILMLINTRELTTSKSRANIMEKTNTFPNVNYTKFCKTDLTLILKRHITVTPRKVYITISGKNFEQNIL